MSGNNIWGGPTGQHDDLGMGLFSMWPFNLPQKQEVGEAPAREMAVPDLSDLGGFIGRTAQSASDGYVGNLQGQEDRGYEASDRAAREAYDLSAPEHPGYGMRPGAKGLLALATVLGTLADPKRKAGIDAANTFTNLNRETVDREHAVKVQKANHDWERKLLEVTLNDKSAERARSKRQEFQGQQRQSRQDYRENQELGLRQGNQQRMEQQAALAEMNRVRDDHNRAIIDHISKTDTKMTREAFEFYTRQREQLMQQGVRGPFVAIPPVGTSGIAGARIEQGDRRLDQGDRRLDQSMKRNQAFFENNKSIMARRIIQNGVDDARTAQILQKTANYDAEFQLKFADTMSKIASRGDKGSGGKPVSVTDLTKLHNLNKQQLKAWRDQGAAKIKAGDIMGAGELMKKIQDLEMQNQAIMDQARGTLQQKAAGGSKTSTGRNFKVIK